MAGVNTVQARTTEGNDVKPGDEARLPRVHSESASSSSSSQRGARTRRPDGTSEEPGPSELRSLEQALRRESVVDVIDIGPLSVPSTPVRDSLDGIGNDVRINLELASVKLRKLAPAD